jgi:DNA-binding response OmpR family regulator
MSFLLLVEDDEKLRRFLVPGLQAEGHMVTVASTAGEGYTRALSDPFDAFIFDVMLPDFTGRQLCQRLRRANVFTPLLMLTALDATEDKVEGLRDGADDYMTKPFDFDELLARVEALVRRGRGVPLQRPSLLRVGDVVLDRSAFSVTRDGQAIDLTAKEFQLLQLLMSSPGKVISRTQILNRVWGYDSDPMTNVVDVNIQRIRSKLHWDAEGGPIRTIRGYGYKISGEEC